MCSELPADPQAAALASRALAEFLAHYPRLFVLTGAGISTGSGIPDYRDHNGQWKRRPPVQHQAFMTDAAVRQRYWARSLVGWPVIRNARPNAAHQALVALDGQWGFTTLVTQNVDRLHQRAGSQRVVDLHGRADEVVCMGCEWRGSRDQVHRWCEDLNPAFAGLSAAPAPDGDADLEVATGHFEVADCPCCGGILKPDVVFFGDFVPGERVATALDTLRQSAGLLVIGSSLMVYSGFRFCRYASEWGKPIATLNLGRTRADELAALSLRAPIAETLIPLAG
ncbi:NAD-dependent protein deacetylase [Marinobacter xestospongiae]|uniref:protein acetyllysine N-acetyltransferase n=1 Tax=Marinobacter xestospongiae TaxID=994319 RepID=A0ABU3W2R0_9GAMM|nr:NAD-dependent protein deacetylase [Marinobacter xestospongiae]MDV2080820.1 NAD-dependent protein deacetylase [Marinobacter xestospongiae]